MSVSGYNVQRQLGKGAFGEVFLARKGPESYAIKVLKKRMLKSKRQGKHGSAFDGVKSEIATMRKMQHPNLVHMFDVIIDLEHEDIFLVLEFVDGGVSQDVSKEGVHTKLTEKTVWSYTRHLVLGLEYLHMNGVVHRDIKPENLMLTKPMDGTDWRMLKIADFGTSCLCEGDANAQKTAGTPHFFSPELCSKDTSGTYDGRAVDLWAVGVTLYLWVSGSMPFNAATIMLLMEEIRNAPEHISAPKGASVGLSAVIEGLLTRDPAKRLTLNQLRLHPWLTENGRQPLPEQVAEKIELTAEEIEQAFSNRQAIAYQSAAGPSALGKAIGVVPDWKREGLNMIRKLSNEVEARLYETIATDGNLSHHVPVIYSVRERDGTNGDARESPRAADSSYGAVPPPAPPPMETFEVRMQDLAAGMTRPCAMGIVMGTRTIVPDGGVQEDLDALDHATSTASLGFRIDAARTVVQASSASFVNGSTSSRTSASASSRRPSREAASFGRKSHSFTQSGNALMLDTLPLPDDLTLNELKEEAHILSALENFFQADTNVCKGSLLALEEILRALERSAFFAKHVLLRSSLLLVFDDAARTNVQFKMINFSFSYALPEGAPPLKHTGTWDGKPESHEDGYLTGVKSLVRLMRKLHADLEIRV